MRTAKGSSDPTHTYMAIGRPSPVTSEEKQAAAAYIRRRLVGNPEALLEVTESLGLETDLGITIRTDVDT